MDQYSEISDFLGNLVQDDGNRGGNSDRNADQIACSQDKAVNEVVHTVPEQVHERDGMRVIFAGGDMTMAPMNQLLHHKGEDDAEENVGSDVQSKTGFFHY